MRILFFCVLVTVTQGVFAQPASGFNFGDITEADLSRKSYSIDTSAPAVVLGESGSTRVVGNSEGGFSLEFKIRRRIHILKNSAYDKATVSVDLYTDGETDEKISSLRAYTYNLEGGKITETKLNPKSAIFTEKISRNLLRKKFALAGVKEGSVIDYEYTVTSDFLFNLQPWYFQGDIPCLWSEYNASLPQFLDYMMLQQGSLPYFVETNSERQGAYEVQYAKEVYAGKTVNERVELTCMIADYRWVMKDIPAFRVEAFTSSPENFVSKMHFQLAAFRAPLQEKSILTTWPEFTADMLKGLDFINEMENAGEWWPSDMKTVLKGTSTETEIAKAIYNYVRQHYTCSGDNLAGKRTSLKKIAAAKNGNNLELNLLLMALLRNAGLRADPVMLSTKPHGLSTESNPVIGQLNYMVCRVSADGDDWFLDASHPFMGFGKLSPDCYNGQARVLNSEATLLHLTADQLTESDQAEVFISGGKQAGTLWTGHIKHQYGYYASEKIREQVKKEGNQGLNKELADVFEEGLLTDSIEVTGLEDTENSVNVSYHIRDEKEAGDIIYLNPVFIPHYRQNPLKSENRRYPVELPYKISQLYKLTMEIPEGYIVDDLPAPLLVKLNEKNEAAFDYMTAVAGKVITLTYSLEIAKTTFRPEEYNALRGFFSKMVAKLGEQIVLKKK
ncbi:MAG: DUF3857 domain-containing protein [Sphingobacteriales bacterium]|nr:DUF3857 domain-containing protein [Sphingobacteriales bacterium]